MVDIATPTTARKTEEFTPTQINLVRTSLGIADFPYQPDKTYIVFDATSGDNDLHIISGGSNTYSILKGDGSQPTDYIDTGGTKTINYTNAGRYLITIEGTFNGIDTSAASAGDKLKYIGVIGGSNYPVTIPAQAFDSCENLVFFEKDDITTLGGAAFNECTSLKYILFPLVTSIGINIFRLCSSLEYADISAVTALGNSTFLTCSRLITVKTNSLVSIDDDCFKNCKSLIGVNMPLLETIGDNSFESCESLTFLNMPLVDVLGAACFKNCKSITNVHFSLVLDLNPETFSGCALLVSARFEIATNSGQAFPNCTSLESLYIPLVTTIPSSSFLNLTALRYLELGYDAGLTVGATAFSGVSLSDLHVIGAADAGEAGAVETKVLAAGATQLNGYRLLY